MKTITVGVSTHSKLHLISGNGSQSFVASFSAPYEQSEAVSALMDKSDVELMRDWCNEVLDSNEGK